MLSDFGNQNTLGHTTGLHDTAFPYRAKSHSEGPFQGKTGTNLPRHFFGDVFFHKGPAPFLYPHLTHMLWDIIDPFPRTLGKKVGLFLPPNTSSGLGVISAHHRTERPYTDLPPSQHQDLTKAMVTTYATSTLFVRPKTCNLCLRQDIQKTQANVYKPQAPPRHSLWAEKRKDMGKTQL